jgi:hypothetical protein
MILLHASHATGPDPITVDLVILLAVVAVGLIAVATLELAWWSHHFRE